MQTSSRWFCVILLTSVFAFHGSAEANNSFCSSWSDDDFARDANANPQFVTYVMSPGKLDVDLSYGDKSPDRPEIDRIYHFDNSDQVRCKKLAVNQDKISLSDAAARFAKVMYEFRGCGEAEFKKFVDFQHKQFVAKVESQDQAKIKTPATTPERVQRLNWASEYYDKTKGKILALVGNQTGANEQFGSAVFKLKNHDGKEVFKRVNINSVADDKFCESTPAIERRLNALYEQEQNRLAKKASEDGTSECLAWLSSNREFNGSPAGTGLLSYLKIEPVSPSKMNFDENYTRSEETDLDNGNKKLTLKPYQSEDFIAVVRDKDSKLVSAELYTPGVRKSKFNDDRFFNKYVEFGYASGRCAPKSIEYSETVGKFKVSNDSCSEIQKKLAAVPSLPFVPSGTATPAEKKKYNDDLGAYINGWKKIETDMTAFLKKNAVNVARREAKNTRAPSSVVKAKQLEDSRDSIKWFCGQFEPYLGD
ncbi:MAG: hypothetical protein JST80_10965 [Bdellovibrionales bacterium]|nr:hypothetical protein [Bdellovibrionales bacterium]